MKTSNVVIVGVTGAYILWLLFNKKATQPTNTGQQATQTPSTAVSETNQQQYVQPTNNGSAPAAPAVDPVTVVDQIITTPTTTTTTTATSTTERIIPEVQVHTFFPPVKPPVTVVEDVKKPDYSAVDIIEKVITTPSAPTTPAIKPVAASRSMAEKSPYLAAVSFAPQNGRIVARPHQTNSHRTSWYNGHRYWPNRVPKSI